MTKVRLNQAASAVKSAFDRRTVSGVFIGVAIMAAAMATAQTTTAGTGLFTGLFSTGGAGDGGGTTLLSQQDSVVATSLNTEATDCANGAAGTIGDAIKTAMNVHTDIASATPNVESLFDVNSNCFSSISQIFDLSFAIPSLATILTAAENAVVQYAQKKVCTAVNQVTSMVTTPLNQAIANVNQLQGFTNIDGMANSAVSSTMSSIDPQLGSQYHSTSSSTNYTANTNPFSTSQTTFSSNGSGSTNSTLAANTAQINTFTNQIAAQQIQINQDTMAVSNAQNAYNNCSWWDGGCTNEFQALQQAQQQLSADQSQLISLQTQLSQVVTNNSGSTLAPVTSNATPQSVTTTTTNTNSGSTSGSWWSGISGILN
jgi:hypothetical protein